MFIPVEGKKQEENDPNIDRAPKGRLEHKKECVCVSAYLHACLGAHVRLCMREREVNVRNLRFLGLPEERQLREATAGKGAENVFDDDVCPRGM